jgi:hypothetical protein
MSGDQLALPQIAEQPVKHGLCLDHVVKAKPAGLGRIGEGVVFDPKDELLFRSRSFPSWPPK